MREIKFRIKHKVSDQWTYFNIGCVVDNNNDFDTLCQYTGLKDKNGKEIYEGDILKHKTIKSNIVVEYFYAGFDPFCDSLDAEYGFGDTDSENYIVIGNIYENPELLEKK